MPFNSITASEAGRKSKRTENKLAKLIKASADKSTALKIFSLLEEQALTGDLDSIKLYLSYVIGRPKESLELDVLGGLDIIWKEEKTYLK